MRKKIKIKLKTKFTESPKASFKTNLRINLGKMLLKAGKNSEKSTEKYFEKGNDISNSNVNSSMNSNVKSDSKPHLKFRPKLHIKHRSSYRLNYHSDSHLDSSLKFSNNIFDKTNRKLVYVNTIDNFGMEKSLSVKAHSNGSQNTKLQSFQKAFFSYSDSMKIMNYYRSNAMMNNTDTVWFLEYGHCYTCGVSTTKDEMDSLNKSSTPVYKTNRGGKITYHGLGQLIVYFIMNINELNLNYDKLLGCIQDATIDSLKIFGVTGRKKSDVFPNAVGIWVENKKIASIGLRIQNGVSHHGIAINISPDLKFFDYIVPCGLSGVQMTSCRELSDSLKGGFDVNDVSKFCMNKFSINAFCEHFFKLFYENICLIS